MKKESVKKIGLKDRRGIAMTEVTVAFLLLTIIFSMLYHCIRFSSNMMMQAVDTDREVAEYEKKAAEQFTRTSAINPYQVSPAATETIAFEAGGESFSITVGTATKSVNYHEAGNETDGDTRTTDIHIYTSGS